MRPDTKRHIHFGVNFIVAPAPSFGSVETLQFQSKLADPVCGLVFDVTQKDGAQFVLHRNAPGLEIRLGPVGPQVAQFLMTAQNPERRLDEFVDECESIQEVFLKVWPEPKQVLRRDATIRHLYAVKGPHAFQYLWEQRLKQSEASLNAFGRPVLGGGLRFVMPPRSDVQDDPVVEVKVESLLADPSQLFVEAGFAWNAPAPPEAMNPRNILTQVEEYIDNEVRNLIVGDD